MEMLISGRKHETSYLGLLEYGVYGQTGAKKHSTSTAVLCGQLTLTL